MAQNDQDRATPLSLDPETEVIDASWDDDDLASGIELSTPVPEQEEAARRSERVTAVPDIPAEELARQLMGDAKSDAPGPAPADTYPDRDAPRRAPAETYPDRDTPNTFHGVEAPPEPVERVNPYAPTTPSIQRPPLELDLELPGSEPVLELDTEPGAPEHEAPGAEPELEVLDAELSAPDSLDGPALELDDRLAHLPEEPDTEVDPELRDMKDRYATGDFTGALVIAESLLEANPEHEHALRYAESCRDVLTQMYAARVGSLSQIPTVAVAPDQIRWLSLDHRAGFVLSMVDGSSSIEEILDVSGMTRLDALRILYTLIEQRIVVLKPA